MRFRNARDTPFNFPAKPLPYFPFPSMHSDSDKHDPSPAAPDAPDHSASQSAGASNRGARYTIEHRREVVDFVNSHNAIHGRGGQSEAARKYGLSLLTVANWLKKNRVNPISPAVTSHTAGALPTETVMRTVAEYMELGQRIKKAEEEIAHLRKRHETLAACIRQNI